VFILQKTTGQGSGGGRVGHHPLVLEVQGSPVVGVDE
jgi:hypothetical protein